MSEDDIRDAAEEAELEQPARPRRARKPKLQLVEGGAAEPDDGGDGAGDAEAPAEAPKPCPVIPLGHTGGKFVFLSPAGEKRELTAKDMSRGGIMGLFLGSCAWLIQEFRAYDQAGKPKEDWNVSGAMGWLMRECAKAGLWDEATQLRGPGVWLVTEGKVPKIIVHTGDRLGTVTARGHIAWNRAGVRIGETIYIATPKLEAPASAPAAAKDGQAILRAARLWAYERAWAPRVVTGYIGAALLGAAPVWRAHLLIAGIRGTGKSSLVKLVEAALGDQGQKWVNFSEAGVRSALTNRSQAVLLDEAEGKEALVEPVIALLRRMSEGDGRGTRGAPGGHNLTFSVTGPALLAAIHPPILQPQDRSRITEIRLKMPTNTANAAIVTKAIEWAAEHSPALRCRALVGFDRYLANFEVYREAVQAVEAAIGARSVRADNRQADQIGALLAGADMLLTDEPTTPPTAADIVDELRDWIVSTIVEDEEESDAQQCLHTLFTSQVDVWAQGIKSTLGQLLCKALDRMAEGRSNALVALPNFGLKVVYDAGQQPMLVVANKHQGLNRIFTDTDWSEGRWRRALQPLAALGDPDAPEAVKPYSFGGVKSRGTAIPLAALPIDLSKPPPEPPPGGGDPFHGAGQQ